MKYEWNLNKLSYVKTLCCFVFDKELNGVTVFVPVQGVHTLGEIKFPDFSLTTR